MDYNVYDDVETYDYGYEQTNKGSKTFEKKEKRPRYFPSNKPQSFIKNAVTGVPYPYIVGSKEQSMLYKMVDATGTCDPNGFLIKVRNELPNHTTNHLFYDSPEQCMNHLHITLNSEDIERWHKTHRSSEVI